MSSGPEVAGNQKVALTVSNPLYPQSRYPNRIIYLRYYFFMDWRGRWKSSRVCRPHSPSHLASCIWCPVTYLINLPHQVWNALGYSFFLYSTLSTIIGSGDIYHSRKETYLSPAPWAYLIWGPIVFSLTGYVFHQFTQNGRKIILEKISWWFPIFAFLTSGYIHAWVAGYYVLAFFFIFVAGVAVFSIHEIVKSHASENVSIADRGESFACLIFIVFSHTKHPFSIRPISHLPYRRMARRARIYHHL